MKINYSVQQRKRLQKLLMIAVKGLYIQNSLSKLTKDNVNSLRGNNNTKCSLGFLISDEQIDKYNVNIISPIFSYSKYLIEELMPEFEKAFAISFLSDLQQMHDQIKPNQNLRKALINNAKLLCQKFDLNMPSQQEINRWKKKKLS